MNLYEKIQRLCEIRHISINRLEREAGIGRGSIAKWANSMPSANKIAAVAKVLDVPIEHLLANDNTNNKLNDIAVTILLSKQENQNRMSEDERECLDLFRQLSSEDKNHILRNMRLYIGEYKTNGNK